MTAFPVFSPVAASVIGAFSQSNLAGHSIVVILVAGSIPTRTLTGGRL